MVRGGMADSARQARRVGAVLGARTGPALRHGLADGAQAAPRAERAAGIPPRRPTGDRRELLWWLRYARKPGPWSYWSEPKAHGDRVREDPRLAAPVRGPEE